MKVLTINTYAGSLLLGAHAFGAELTGSFEDSGFGQGIAQANFPNIEHIERWADWPKRDLSDTVVLAHPPCSAFSVQNSSWDARGVDSNAFACTKKVLDYATACKARAIAIESVCGALGGAWYVHQAYTKKGYHLYRILQNGCSFDIPQWRERFWVVYVREGVAPETMKWRLQPRWRTVGPTINGYEDGPGCGNTDELLAKVKARMIDKGLTPEQMSLLFDPQDPPHPTAGQAKIIKQLLFPDDDIYDIQHIYLGGGFASGQLCYVDPTKLAGTLLGSSWWYCNGRNLSEQAYKRIMGFPPDYIFPNAGENGSRRNYRRQMRTFLSKGVIPQVATWITGNIAKHLGEAHRPACACLACDPGPSWELDIEPNRIADFRFKRKYWNSDTLPPLRNIEEE